MTNPLRLIRDQDMQEIHRVIANGSTYLILNLHSIRGIGRTSFLQGIWEEYSEQRPTAFIRVPDFLSHDEQVKFRLDLFLLDIIDQLITTSLDLIPGMTVPDTTALASELAQHVVELVDGIAQNGVVPLLLIDDYDQLPTACPI